MLPRRFVRGTRLEELVEMIALPDRIQLRPIGIGFRQPRDLPPPASDFLDLLRVRLK